MELQHLAKENLKVPNGEQDGKTRSSVFYDNIQQQKNTQLEDGRETKFYYERFRCLELCRFMLMLIAQGMNILSYDLEFEQRDEFTNDLISYVIFISTILLMAMTFASIKSKLDYEIASKQQPKEATITNTGKFKQLIFSLLLYTIFPYPWTSSIKIKFDFVDESNGHRREVFYYVNEILTLIMLIRIIIMIQSVLIFSRFSGARPSRVTKYFGCESDALFIVKCMMKKYPMVVFSGLYMASTLFFAFAIRICERPLVRKQDEYWQDQLAATGEINFDQNFNSYSVALWCILISLPTVGYGDRYPRTTLGRIILTITAILGAFLVSLLVNALTSELELTKQERKPFTVLRKLAAKMKLTEAASQTVVKVGRITYKLQKNQHVSQKESKDLHNSLRYYKESQKEYRNIQRDIGSYEQLENEFDVIHKELDQFKTQNQVLNETSDILLEYMEKNPVKTNEDKQRVKDYLQNMEASQEEVLQNSDDPLDQKTNQYQFQTQDNSLFYKNFF